MSADYNPAEYVTVPDGWTCKRLADCTIDGNIPYGIVQPGKHDDNGIPVIRVNNVNNGNLDLSDVLKVSPKVEAKYERTRLKGGEVLLTLVGSTGQSFVAPEELCGWNVPRAIAVIRTKESIGAEWVNICLQSNEAKHFLNVRANTTVQKTLNLKDVRDIPILIPPKVTKASIEKAALSISQKIKLNRQTNQTLKDIAQAIFKSWFINFDPTRAKIRAKENGQDPELAAMASIAGKEVDELDALSEEQLDELKSTAALFPDNLIDSELGQIPEGWEARSFGDVSSCFDSKRIPLSKKQRQEKKPGHIPYYGATSVMDYVNEWIFDDVYLLLGEDGSVIKEDGTPFVQYIWGKSWVNNHAHVLQGKNGVSTEQLMIFIQSQNIASYVTGAVQLKLNQKNMNSIPFLDAGEELNKRFHELITPLYQILRVKSEENKTLEEMKDSLLPKLLSGALAGVDIDG